jgi:hypothetical protein
MKKILVIALLVLLLVSVVDAQKKEKKGGIYAKPTATDSEGNPTGTDNSAKEKGKKTDWYQVVEQDGVKYDGKDAPKGTIIINPDSMKFTGTKEGLIASEIQSTTAIALAKQKYSYDGTTFSYTNTKTTKDDNIFEKYKTTTTTTVTIDEKGNVKKTSDQVTKICGKGLTSCDGTYTEVKGSHFTETATYKPTEKTDEETGKKESRLVLEKRDTAIYGKDGAKVGTLTINYAASDTKDAYSTRVARDITVTGADGKEYYKATIDADGKSTVENNIGDMKGLSADQSRQLRDKIVATGSLDFGDAWKTLTIGQSLGRFMKAYNDYAGLRQITSIFWPAYDEEVQARKAKIQQQFCLAAGITNCVTSAICGTIYNIQADNILAGRGPSGTYVSSASLNAERSLPIDVEGMTRQQLIDLFGNSTVIKGVWINLTDPNFNPRILGAMRLRLYHVQYSVTNNAEGKKDLNYNIVFEKVPQEFNSSYGTPVGSARWWKSDQTISNLQTARDDVYKFSATEYNSVCLKFDPKLPSGHAAFSQLVGELCVPFAEYAGGPTEISKPTNATQGAAAAGPSAAVAETPGALV